MTIKKKENCEDFHWFKVQRSIKKNSPVTSNSCNGLLQLDLSLL